MAGFSEQRRMDRMNQGINYGDGFNEGYNQSFSMRGIISNRAYNLVMGGVLFYGILINIILCVTVGNVLEYVNPIAWIIGYVVLCIIGIVMSSKSSNPVISFIGYNFVVVPMGLVISTAVEAYGGIDSRVVVLAFVYTAIITGCMITLSVVKPEFFATLGRFLFVALIGLVVCELVLLIFRVDQVVTAWISAGIFSLYIGYDIYRSQQFPKTVDNAVDCALDIYIDIANLFMDILRILGRSDND
ncbi:MAG: Bax inhibitor-1 family protein [Lachnospiraceae bacterium]